MNKLPLGPLMVDVGGLTLSEEDTHLLACSAVGAVILFSRNFQSKQQVSSLIAEIKAIRTPSLLVAVDQEGGRVQRFKDGFTLLPPVFRIGEHYHKDKEFALAFCRTAGALMAKELIEVGVDISFAPVLDCADLNSKVIGDRGFHAAPKIISALAHHYIKGMNDSGMAATGKHFPGHGHVIADSHHELPVDTRTMKEIAQSDLLPYMDLAAVLAGVMTAHIHFPNIDDHIPTYSSYWINTVLRERVGFDGLVFSDDLTMKAAAHDDSALERTRRALSAGCDMAIICNDSNAANHVAQNLAFDHGPGKRLEAMKARANNNAHNSSDTHTLRKKLAGFLAA